MWYSTRRCRGEACGLSLLGLLDNIPQPCLGDGIFRSIFFVDNLVAIRDILKDQPVQADILQAPHMQSLMR